MDDEGEGKGRQCMRQRRRRGRLGGRERWGGGARENVRKDWDDWGGEKKENMGERER